MYQKMSLVRKISLILGITTLLLGLVPVPVLSRVGRVSADSEVVDPAPSEEPAAAEPPASQPTASEPAATEPVVVDPVVVDPVVAEEPLAEALPPAEEPPLAEEPAGDVPAENPQVSEPPAGDLALRSFGPMLLMASAPIGDDPNIASELPDFGNTYSNGDCVTNDACETAEPVTNPNDYTDQGGYGEKDYTLPDIGGNTANIVAIKEGNDWYFFKKGSGETCVEDTFCVEFDDQGNVKVYSYQTQGNGYKGYNMIHFWFVLDDTEEGTPGCMDETATNYNPDATRDDGSCEYDETVPGCMDQTATNYNPDATEDDGSCEFDEVVLGCMDQTATNYNPDATEDDGSCTYEEKLQPLGIDAVCTEGEGGYFLSWYIKNPNGKSVNASWNVNGSGGGGSVAPGSTFIGTTPVGNASYSGSVSWDGGEDGLTAAALCRPTTPGEPTTTTTTLVSAPAQPAIIPVTGADLDHGFALYRRFMLMAGALLVGAGLLARRKKDSEI